MVATHFACCCGPCINVLDMMAADGLVYLAAYVPGSKQSFCAGYDSNWQAQTPVYMIDEVMAGNIPWRVFNDDSKVIYGQLDFNKPYSTSSVYQLLKSDASLVASVPQTSVLGTVDHTYEGGYVFVNQYNINVASQYQTNIYDFDADPNRVGWVNLGGASRARQVRHVGDDHYIYTFEHWPLGPMNSSTNIRLAMFKWNGSSFLPITKWDESIIPITIESGSSIQPRQLKVNASQTTAFLTTARGNLYAIDLANGSVLASNLAPVTAGGGQLAVGSNDVYIVRQQGSTINLLRFNFNGSFTKVWEVSLDADAGPTAIGLAGNSIVALFNCGTANVSLIELNKATGAVIAHNPRLRL